ncbi:MAG: sphinganine kinase lcb4 [Piccolia ochrophora]|nr:MAG: sphinganine kinase lcb4 [Piccolia ochrophora]
MAPRVSVDQDPFADPSSFDELRQPHADATLVVSRHASLSLGTDSLIVLDDTIADRDGSKCCGLASADSKTTRAIPYFNVLWADLFKFDLTIRHATPTSKNVVRVSYLHFPVDKTDRRTVTAWIDRLLGRAYNASLRRKRVKVLINPFGGKGSAQKWYLSEIEPIFTAARCELDIQRTQARGHAIEIAEQLDVDKYDVVACCSGDGVPYEVFNGFGRRKDARNALARVAVVQLPCGTGNAMSLNLNGTDSPSLAALCVVKGLQTPLDLISITQGDRRTLSFLSQSLGIVAESDLGTENLRWMGSARFTYGVLVRLLRQAVYPCDIAVKVVASDKGAIRDRYRQEITNQTPAGQRRGNLSLLGNNGASDDGQGLPPLEFGTVMDELPTGWDLVPHDTLGSFFAGNMAWVAPDTDFFPAALPNDGCLDLVRLDGGISRLKSLNSLTAVANNTFFDLSYVSYQKLAGYRIIPKSKGDGYISIDGERVPFEPFQAEVHQGLGTVLSKNGHTYEAPGV